MPIQVPMPKLGLTMTEGLIARWLVVDGMPVVTGMPIFVVETDKATLEVPAPAEGVLNILIEEGRSVPIGQSIATIRSPEEEIASTSELPVVPMHDLIASPAAKRRAAELEVDIHQVKGTGGGGRITQQDVEEYATRRETPVAPEGEAAAASPIARRRALEAGIDLSAVTGTGPGGRISRDDVEKAITLKNSTTDSAPPAIAAKTIPMNGVRALIAQRMQDSAQQTARVTLMTELDATELVSMRGALKPDLERRGISLTYDALLVVIIAKVLGEFPFMNATQVGGEIRLLEEINVGIAVDTERGLIVPVLRNANKKTILDVTREVNELTRRAKAGTISPDELHGSTFTLTNLGMFDVDAFTPIINLPELAILGVGRIMRRPAEFEGQIVLRQRMTLSLSFDHRLVDGTPAARFLQRIKQVCETPYLLLTLPGQF